MRLLTDKELSRCDTPSTNREDSKLAHPNSNKEKPRQPDCRNNVDKFSCAVSRTGGTKPDLLTPCRNKEESIAAAPNEGRKKPKRETPRGSSKNPRLDTPNTKAGKPSRDPPSKDIPKSGLATDLRNIRKPKFAKLDTDKANPSRAKDCVDTDESNIASVPTDNAPPTPISMAIALRMGPVHVNDRTGNMRSKFAASGAGRREPRQATPCNERKLSK